MTGNYASSVYHLLFTCLLFTTWFTIYRLPFTIYCLLFTIYYLLFTIYFILFTVYYLLVLLFMRLWLMSRCKCIRAQSHVLESGQSGPWCDRFSEGKSCMFAYWEKNSNIF